MKLDGLTSHQALPEKPAKDLDETFRRAEAQIKKEASKVQEEFKKDIQKLELKKEAKEFEEALKRDAGRWGQEFDTATGVAQKNLKEAGEVAQKNLKELGEDVKGLAAEIKEGPLAKKLT